MRKYGCGCSTVGRNVKLTEEEMCIDETLSVALEGGDVTKCGMTELVVFFETLYFSTAGEKMWFIRCVFCCLGVKLVCDTKVWPAKPSYYSFLVGALSLDVVLLGL